MDISLYNNPDHYQSIQLSRPDYLGVVNAIKSFSIKYLSFQNILDLCGGTGYFSSLIASYSNVDEITLIDINKTLLDQATGASWGKTKISPIHSDVLDYKFNENTFDLVLSIFAYHHIPDAKKLAYVQNAYKALKQNGMLLLAEIYSPNKNSTLNYYAKLLEHISPEKRIKELQAFLTETAQSDNVEFKVSKDFSDRQFTQIGFHLEGEQKIWPLNMPNSSTGTFLQIYKK